jgi:glycosyltransferase involved in cell wall biosynthesis
MTCTRYKIHHLNLAAWVSPVVDSHEPEHYCVFWYNSIPLGHAFLSLKQISSQTTLIYACVKAIRPAVEFYLEKKLSDSINTLKDIERHCGQTLLHYTNGPIPAQADISVIICTKDRASSLRNCLSALQRQACHPSEIVVVDNGSITNETQKVAEDFKVRYIREDNPGLDVARNTGARAAAGSIIAYTDDDTTPHEHWIHQIARTFKNDKISAMTGLVLAGTLNSEAEVIFEKYWPFNRGYLQKTYDQRFFNSTLQGGPPVWEIGAGANMAFRKSIFDKVGYFDERLDVGAAGCSGDSEMWYRILANGYSIHYNPMAVVNHYHRTSIDALKAQLYAYMRGFTVAILIQYQRFRHTGNLKHLFRVLPFYYLSLLKKGFPFYRFQYQTLFSEMRGVAGGLVYFLKNRNTRSGILPE